jgi:hypothetical protein
MHKLQNFSFGGHFDSRLGSNCASFLRVETPPFRTSAFEADGVGQKTLPVIGLSLPWYLTVKPYTVRVKFFGPGTPTNPILRP